MKNSIQGPSYNVAIASIVVILINILKDKYEDQGSSVSECIHCLEDFLWSFAGIATNDGDEEQCDDFLKSCGYEGK